jgi:hypothetical protein
MEVSLRSTCCLRIRKTSSWGTKVPDRSRKRFG